jgi:hypothetical protein
MSFILRWLGLGKPGGRIGLRPHRDVEIAQPYEAAYDRVLDAMVRVLGANVTLDDRRAGTIEAAFGLVNNERIRCTFSRVESARTPVKIEALFPVGSEIPERSRAVDALADWLESSG